jgi:HEPN domain-containing protein
MTQLLTACREAGLEMSAVPMGYLEYGFLNPSPNFNHRLAKEFAKDAIERITDELKLKSFYRLTPEAARLHDDPYPFGEVVVGKFPSTQVDIEEAAKCLALGRATATVFHLMRVMEVGLKALGTRLGVDIDSTRSWEGILNKSHGMMTKPYTVKPPEWAGDEAFLSEAVVMLTAVKTAWRNPTMHIERLYTLEQADDVWRAAKSFMGQLATKLEEIP